MLPSEKIRIESMLFDYETTYLTSYRGGSIPELVKTEYQDKKRHPVRPPHLYKDTHTLTPCKTVVPFYLLHKPKEIVRTNPHLVQGRYEAPEDIDRKAVQKTRPRLVMTPAVSLDDIDNENARETLIRDMYTSDMTRATREAVAPVHNIQAPLPIRPAPANSVLLPRLQPQRVPPEWRMESIAWDARQLRCYCDPTRDFWVRKEPSKCTPCREAVIVHSHRKMMRK